MLQDFQIPVPPLAIQTRIVEILDHFTNLTANHTAELALRRKQFEHFREKLLSLDGVEGVEWKKLGEVFDTRNGYTPSKANSKFWKDGNIPWFRMEDIRDKGRFLSDSYLHITESAIKGKGLFKANSFILATTATIGEHALLIADSQANQRFTNLQIRKSLSDKLDVMFMYYYMFVVDDFCKSHTNKSGFASVDMGALKKMPIPLPPLATQHSIVSILDKFTALIENIEKELALRQKQYEYYREELLRFGG
ncbi:MAG: restriction endonuclease subunit S [Bacteroidales bacterium]|nr:restriction endonuclease subunit S [Bacteroidales bacterium]